VYDLERSDCAVTVADWAIGVESGDATTELKTAIARALVDPTRENILASLDTEHKATPLVAVDVLHSLPTDQQLRYRDLVAAFWRAEARGR
jgi:hypothetical protein